MPRWVMHSTNSRTRATHCVIPNKDLLLVLMEEKKKGRKSQFSCWITSNIFSPTSRNGPQEIRFHHRATHLQHFIHAGVYNIDPPWGNGFIWGIWGYGHCSAGGSQVHTTQIQGRICLTVFSSWKNCPLPLIFRVKSRWQHSKQAVFRLPQQCSLAAPLRIWTLMRSTKTYHPGLTCSFIQTEWYPRGTLIRCSNRLNRFHRDSEGAFLLLSFIRMADLHPQPQEKAQTPSGANDGRLIASGQSC